MSHAVLMGLSPEGLSKFNSSPIPMWIFDTHSFAFLAVNDAAVRNYGYSREQFLAMTILDIRPSEDVIPLVREELKQRKHHSAQEIWRHRKSDGSVIGVSISSQEIRFNSTQAEIVTAEEIHREELPREDIGRREYADKRTV